MYKKKTNNKLHWGVDLGGTKIECIVLDDNNNSLIRERIATEASQGFEHIISRIKLLIDEVSAKLLESPCSIGFSTPGSLDKTSGLMKFCNTTCLNNQPLKQSLEKILKVPCYIENDANCFALAETKLGAVSQDFNGINTVFGVIMGTGVGAGIVVDGKILSGPNQCTGEWGHNILYPNGIECYCGKKGCVEKYISGPGVQNDYYQLSGQKLSLQDILKLSKTGDKLALATLDNLYRNFGIALSRVVNSLDPDVIVLGGGVSNIQELYTESHKYILEELFNDSFNTPIIAPLLGDSAGVYGAALLTK